MSAVISLLIPYSPTQRGTECAVACARFYDGFFGTGVERSEEDSVFGLRETVGSNRALGALGIGAHQRYGRVLPIRI